MNIPAEAVIRELKDKNLVIDAGRVTVGSEFITIEPTGLITGIKEFENIMIRGATGRQIYLRDIGAVRRGYVEPQDTIIRYDGKASIGMGISTVQGGNVVTMGTALKKRLAELMPQIPLGIQLGIISMQPDTVEKSVKGFTQSLIEAVAIVIGVLLIFMGARSGLIMGFILVLTTCGSFIFLNPMGVLLERISLGALIIALGMLVDDAIVIVEGMLVRTQGGMDGKKAAGDLIRQSAFALLGATIISVLAFAIIGTSPDSTGEFCRSLFQVIGVSLMFSWVTAMTATPLISYLFLKPPKSGQQQKDPYGNKFFAIYKNFIHAAIRRRWMTLALVICLFITALWGFTFVKKSFFPPSTRDQFMVDIWLPQGTHIDTTAGTVKEVEQFVLKQAGVTHVTSLVGKGGLRFLLTYQPEKKNSCYAQLLVDVDDMKKIDVLMPEIESHLAQQYPDMLAYCSKFQLGPGSTGKVQARFSGPDANKLRELAEKTMAIMHADGNAKAIRTDWNQRVKVERPIIAQEQANLNGITREQIADALRYGFQGLTMGVYREGDLLLPIIGRASEEDRADVNSINNIQLWSPAAQKRIPFRQVISGFETAFEDEIIQRRNRSRTITVYCDPQEGVPSVLFKRLRPQIEALELPMGYKIEWGGEYEDSAKAQGPLMASMPVFVIGMFIVTVALFNSIRQSLVIWGCVPLSIIGVTVGLLVTGQPFGFMALLGFMSLSGTLVKNAIVLLDEINYMIGEGKPVIDAIVDSAVTRLRPVAMTASTTALGLIPLLTDAFFSAMAVTIVSGLLFAATLTMVVVPVLYSIIFRVPNKA
jgi:multidrug efflux pump subunit AcrB